MTSLNQILVQSDIPNTEESVCTNLLRSFSNLTLYTGVSVTSSYQILVKSYIPNTEESLCSNLLRSLSNLT